MESTIFDILTNYGVLGILVFALGFFMKNQIDNMQQSIKEQYKANNDIEMDYRAHLKESAENRELLIQNLTKIITENTAAFERNTQIFAELKGLINSR